MEDWIRLRPTREQYQAFAAYLCEAHSWYKHLSLLEGRRFVVFVALDSGIGRLVATLHGSSPAMATGFSLVTPPEGPEFTDAHPRLHYGWKTTREYRTRFGFLDYMRQYPGEPFVRDAGPPVRLPASIEQRCSFVLYPYAHPTFAEAVTWDIHAEAIQQLRGGASHPDREEVLELAKRAEALHRAWARLSDREREWVLSRPFVDRSTAGELSVEMRSYLDLEEGVQAISGSLQAREAGKIQEALENLDDWLLHGEPGESG